MSPGRRHYEQAFESYLRERRIPFISVDEAHKALLPGGPRLRAIGFDGGPIAPRDGVSGAALKSFDLVVYGRRVNLLLDVKGRRIPTRRVRIAGRAPEPAPVRSTTRRPRLECWVTRDDVNSLRAWEALFGSGFEAGFIFVYWCDEQPPDALFQEVFIHRSRWYALRGVRLRSYLECMRVRSRRWGTVDLPSADFERISQPFGPAWITPTAERSAPFAG